MTGSFRTVLSGGRLWSAQPADVTLTIYAVNRQIVRQLSLGYQRAGIYKDKARAAYWDGRNAVGEPVASGVYFYTFTAGDFNATRKMLIQGHSIVHFSIEFSPPGPVGFLLGCFFTVS